MKLLIKVTIGQMSACQNDLCQDQLTSMHIDMLKLKIIRLIAKYTIVTIGTPEDPTHTIKRLKLHNRKRTKLQLTQIK